MTPQPHAQYQWRMDAATRPGTMHVVNQDHVEVIPRRNLVMLADGCGSVDGSEWSGRLFARAIDKYDYESSNHHFAHAADVMRDGLNLPPESIYGTCLIAQNDEARVVVEVWGDGAVLEIYRDGRVVLNQIQASGNAPPYPAYSLTATNWEYWRKAFGGTFQVERYELWPNLRLIDTYQGTSERGVPSFACTRHAQSLKGVVLLSDGYTSFPRFRDADPTDPEYAEFLLSLVDFKNNAGAYVQRRMARLAKQWQEWSPHADDLSIAAAFAVEITPEPVKAEDAQGEAAEANPQEVVEQAVEAEVAV